MKGGSKWKGKKLKSNYLCKCISHYGVGFGGRLRAPEAERLNRLFMVHSRSPLDLNKDFH